MNLLIKDKRQYLPTEKRMLLEHKEKMFKHKRKLSVFMAVILFVVTIIISIPYLIPRTVQPYVVPLYGVSKNPDPVITQKFNVKYIEGKDIASFLKLNNITDPGLATQARFAEVILVPQVNQQQVKYADGRALKLYKYLSGRHSPMASSASAFVNVADQFGFDYRLLVGIAVTESQAGVAIPVNRDGSLTYNSFGWGVFDGHALGFASWDDGIRTVGKGIAKEYGPNNINPRAMEAIYCPPARFDHHWSASVLQVMSEI